MVDRDSNPRPRRRDTLLPIAATLLLGAVGGMVPGYLEGAVTGRQGCMETVRAGEPYSLNSLTADQLAGLVDDKEPIGIATVDPGLARALAKSGFKGIEVSYYAAPNGQADPGLPQHARDLSARLASEAQPPVINSVTPSEYGFLFGDAKVTVEVTQYHC